MPEQGKDHGERGEEGGDGGAGQADLCGLVPGDQVWI
jgi:hypothetical protein